MVESDQLLLIEHMDSKILAVVLRHLDLLVEHTAIADMYFEGRRVEWTKFASRGAWTFLLQPPECHLTRIP